MPSKRGSGAVRDGDVIIAHMNRPASDSAEGLAAGLSELLRKGYAFVRLDQADLVAVQDNPARKVAKLKKQANRANIYITVIQNARLG